MFAGNGIKLLQKEATAGPRSDTQEMMNRMFLTALLLTPWCVTGCQDPDADATTSPERVVPAVAVSFHLASETQTEGYLVMTDSDDLTIYVDPDPIVSERDIINAEIHTDTATNQDGVLVTFDAAAAERLREVTATHLDKPLAIKVNDRIIAVPFISSAFGERAVLMGDLSPMTPAELAQALAPAAED